MRSCDTTQMSPAGNTLYSFCVWVRIQFWWSWVQIFFTVAFFLWPLGLVMWALQGWQPWIRSYNSCEIWYIAMAMKSSHERMMGDLKDRLKESGDVEPWDHSANPKSVKDRVRGTIWVGRGSSEWGSRTFMLSWDGTESQSYWSEDSHLVFVLLQCFFTGC